MRDAGQTSSVWLEPGTIPSDGPLGADTVADVCVVGAGIAGLSVAYQLAAVEGARVVVLDAGEIGGGMTSRSTAHVVTALDDHYTEVERLYGAEGARLAHASHAAAIDRAEAIVGRERITCDFSRVDGYLFAHDAGGKHEVRDELLAAQRAGAEVSSEIRAPIADFDTGRCTRFHRQAQFDPMRYLAGLATAIRAHGGLVHTGSAVGAVAGGEAPHAHTASGRVQAGSVVIATNMLVDAPFALSARQEPYRTYVVAGRVPNGSIPRALFWDTAEPYHYVRLARDAQGHDVLVAGGEDHRTTEVVDAARRFAAVERWTRARWPMLDEVSHRWSGDIMEPVDALAFIGRHPTAGDNTYVVTGDSGNGITHAIIASLLLADVIAGRPNDWAGIYDPARNVPVTSEVP